MQKFVFSIRTRDGQKVENIVIAGRDKAEAERKLKQMYRYCEVVNCVARSMDGKSQQSMSVEEVLSLISR